MSTSWSLDRLDGALDAVEPEIALVRALRRIYRARMTTTSGGNLSVRAQDGTVWITPSAEDKGRVVEADIVRIDPSGRPSGRHAPSSELPFHRAIYDARPDLNAVVHAHPIALVAFSMAGQTPDTSVIPEVRAVCGTVGWAPYGVPGTEELGARIAATFARGHDIVLLENHGVVVAGSTLRQAFERFETIERTAQTLLRGRALGGVRGLTDAELALAQHPSLPFDDAGGTDVRAPREELCEFVLRSCAQGLAGSTTGSLSLRLDERRFVITPAHQDRWSLRPDDLVCVTDGRIERGKHASRAAGVHAAIYARHPEVRSVINATPISATAFAIASHDLESRTIPESFVCLRTIQRVPFGLPYQSPDALAARLSIDQPTALLDHDGVLVLGRSLLEAYDRLEVMETTAQSFIEALALGGVNLLSPKNTQDLFDRFVRPSGAEAGSI